MFTENDLKQFKSKGLTASKVEQQINSFKKGFPFMNLARPAMVGDGIMQIDKVSRKLLVEKYDSALSSGLKVVKFIPASGAATRMFKSLFEFLALNADEQKKQLEKGAVAEVINNISKFAFADDLVAKSGVNLKDSKSVKSAASLLIDYLLNEKGLNYGIYPKGVLKFHSYGETSRTPIEEHMLEGALYAKDAQNNVSLHFTVSAEHENLFKMVIGDVIRDFEKKYKVKFQIAFSQQKSSTDTIAVGGDNEPFRKESGEILFRPGGHGALIENLNDIDADIIFIKNIDNVVPEHLVAETVEYKKVIAGTLIWLNGRAHQLVARLKSGKKDPNLFEDCFAFIQDELLVPIVNSIKEASDKEKKAWLLYFLDRPMRICGMVKNEGEPGGGPFWTQEEDGTCSLQIVESSQIDPKSAKQQAIAKGSTHFNPVDLVCSVKNYEGKKFNLTQFVDPKTGFISEKSQNGKALRALELPGLWNGAMANWITLFVEVPISTFNPVKTINDLLRTQHQPK